MFPNVVLNVHSDMYTIFRARPGDHAGHSHFDFWLFHRLGDRAGSGPPPEMIQFPEGRSSPRLSTKTSTASAGCRPGMASNGIKELVLGDFDCRLVNMHAELDRFWRWPEPLGPLEAPPSGPIRNRTTKPLVEKSLWRKGVCIGNNRRFIP